MAQYAAEIIREAGAGPLAFVSLGLLILAYLSARWFGRDHVGVRLVIFGALFLMIGLTAFIVTQRDSAAKDDKSVDGITPTPESEPGPAPVTPAPKINSAPTPEPRPTPSRFEKAINDGVFNIYFEHDRVNLTSREAEFVDDIVDEIARRGVNRIRVSGHTDRWGSATYNVGRSDRMASAVRDHLVARGVPADKITTEAFGEQRPVADTPDGDPNAENRRVEVRFE